MTVLQDQKWKWVCQKKGGDVPEEEERVGNVCTAAQISIITLIVCGVGPQNSS